MAFPSVESVTTTSGTSAVTSHSVNIPAVVPGDLLVVGYGAYVSNLTGPTGWVELAQVPHGDTGGVWAWKADVTQGATTVTFLVDSGSRKAVFQCYKITAASWGGTLATDVDIVAIAAGFGSTKNCPEVTAGWGSDDNLFIGLVTLNSDANDIVAAAATNYSNLITTPNDTAISGSCSISSFRRELAAASDDPAAVSLTPTSSAGMACSIVIRPAAAGLSASINQASETDTSQAIVTARQVAIAQAQETDTSQPVATSVVVQVGLAIETDGSIFGASLIKTASPGQATEADTASTMTPAGATSVGQASEADSGQPLALDKAQALGIASESDLGQALAALKTHLLGFAVETDTGQGVTITGAVPVGQAQEADTGFAILLPSTVVLGLAGEVDTANPVTAGRAALLTFAQETAQAFAIGLGKGASVGQAVETESGLTITVVGGQFGPSATTVAYTLEFTIADYTLH